MNGDANQENDCTEAGVSARDTFVTALAGDSFGLDGFVKLKSLSGESAHLVNLKSVVLRRGGNGTRRTIEETRLLGNGELLVKFSGINSCEEAKKLRGSEVLVAREFAAPLSDGEFYIEDLKGIIIVSAGGEPEGVIADIVEGGGGFLVEARLNSSRTCLIPFRNEFFGSIDCEKRTVPLLAPWIIRDTGDN